MNQGCQKISSKLRFCFFPETKTLHFRKIEFLYCVFFPLRFACEARAQAHQHKTEPCFVSKFPEGHSSLRLKKIGMSEVRREQDNEGISGCVTQRRTTIGVRLEVGPLVDKFNRINCFFYLLFVLIQKVTKIPKIRERLSGNFFKTTVLFSPRNRNASFQKN